MSTAAIAIPFDTLAFVKRLETAGVPSAQAEAQAETLSDVLQKVEESRFRELASRGDVELVKREIELVKKDIERVRGEIELAKEALRKEIEIAKNETIKWMVGLALAQLAMMAGILMTLMRVLPGGH
ncbi:MAG: DUF1640 domain-containing protein [Magnetococcales bacterium]|nr:DUF1640 domain-containing protein [Magnetococcales bacterium]